MAKELLTKDQLVVSVSEWKIKVNTRTHLQALKQAARHEESDFAERLLAVVLRLTHRINSRTSHFSLSKCRRVSIRLSCSVVSPCSLDTQTPHYASLFKCNEKPSGHLVKIAIGNGQGEECPWANALHTEERHAVPTAYTLWIPIQEL
jgi:hypothetical protein